MCITIRVRHRCQHLGRIQGFDSCNWFDDNEDLIERGVDERGSSFITNNELCKKDSSDEYRYKSTLCVTCEEQEKQKRARKEMKGFTEREMDRIEEDGSEKGSSEDMYDENRDFVLDLFPRPHPLYDPRRKVKFSIGPSSSGSSSRSLGDSASRPSSIVKEKVASGPSNDKLLPYQRREPRFEYPIGDIIMKDMSRFEKHFEIQPPDSENWIFSSGNGDRCVEFAHLKNAYNPALNAKHYGDVYPNDVIQVHLMKYLRKENYWKASAFSLHRFACMAKGYVHLLLPRDCKDPLHPYVNGAGGPVDSHWELYQAWALTKMGRVRKITRYNEDDFSKVGIIWQIGQPILGEPPNFWVGPRPLEIEFGIDSALYSSAFVDS